MKPIKQLQDGSDMGSGHVLVRILDQYLERDWIEENYSSQDEMC